MPLTSIISIRGSASITAQRVIPLIPFPRKLLDKLDESSSSEESINEKDLCDDSSEGEDGAEFCMFCG